MLQETWTDRDFPVLREVARRFEESPGTMVTRETLAGPLGLEADDVTRALVALTPGMLVIESSQEIGASMPDLIVRGVTERGRRAVGLWPAEGGVDALVYALTQAAENAPSEEERSKLRRAAAAVVGVGRDVMTEVLSNVVVRSTMG